MQRQPSNQNARPLGETRWKWWGRRIVIALFCVGYLGVTGYFAGRHLLGDSLSHELAYFFTWDMFPGYATESSRRKVVGLTRDDRFVQVLPARWHRYRTGINGAVSRIDIDKQPENLTPTLQRLVSEYNRRHPEAPIEHAVIVEEYWPHRFNLPDDLYEDVYGEPNPRRRYWRIVGELIIGPDGRIERGLEP